MEDKDKPKKEVWYLPTSRLVGGRFNKQGDLIARLDLGSCKTSRSSHLNIRILKVYIEALTGFSHVYCLDGLNSKLLSPVCTLENGSAFGISGWNIYSFEGQRRGKGASDYPGPVHRSIAGHDLSITSLTKSKEYVKRHRREAISKS